MRMMNSALTSSIEGRSKRRNKRNNQSVLFIVDQSGEKFPVIAVFAVAFLTILIASLAIFPFVFRLVTDVSLAPQAEDSPGEGVVADVSALAEMERARAEEGGALFRTIPSLRETVRPVRIAPGSFPYSAVFAVGASSFEKTVDELDLSFVEGELGIRLPPSENYLILVILLPIHQKFDREGWSDVQTLLDVLKPEQVLAILRVENGRLSASLSRNEVTEKLLELRGS